MHSHQGEIYRYFAQALMPNKPDNFFNNPEMTSPPESLLVSIASMPTTSGKMPRKVESSPGQSCNLDHSFRIYHTSVTHR